MIVLKIILFILLAVLGIILLLLLMPISLSFSYIGGEMKYSLKYALVPFFDTEGKGILSKMQKDKDSSKTKDLEGKISERDLEEIDDDAPESPRSYAKRGKKSKKSSKSEKNANNEDNENIENGENNDGRKKTIGEMTGMLLDIWRCAKKPVCRLFKGFRFSKIYIDFTVADEDAYKCALNYGRVCGAVYNLLAFMRLVFTSKEKTVDVTAGFGKEKSRWDVSFTLRFFPITLVASGLWFLMTYIFRIYLPGRKSPDKKQKLSRKAECEVKI